MSRMFMDKMSRMNMRASKSLYHKRIKNSREKMVKISLFLCLSWEGQELSGWMRSVLEGVSYVEGTSTS
jgi:hypothetical protein